jgi:hypothetical protein
MDTRRLDTSSTFKTDHAQSFRNSFGKDSMATILHFNGTSLSSSFPTSLLPHSRVVEVIRVLTDTSSRVQGLSYSFREAIGAPLFSTAIVEVSPAVVAAGPYITEKDKKVLSPEKPDDSEPAESQSFLRRYWWVIAGFFLLSSFLGSSGPDQQDPGAAGKPSSATSS